MAKESKEEGEGSNNNNRPACAACRHQRRKCKQDCVLAPYFPTDKTQQYLAVHKVFGFSNMAKMLSNLDEQERKEAVMSFEWEAFMWQQDPVLGPLGAYKKACEMISSLLTQQNVPISEPNLMGMTHDLSVFNNSSGSNEALAVAVSKNGVPPLTNNWALNNVNGAPIVANNIGQTSHSAAYNEKSTVPHSCVNSVGKVLGNGLEDSEVLNCVAAPNALHHHGQALMQRSSSLLQPNYVPNLTSVAVPDVIGSSAMNQPSLSRGFQYCNDNRFNRQMGMLRGVQGTKGNVENIYADGHGQGRGIISQRGRAGQAQQDHEVVIPVESSVVAANADHAMANNRLRSPITDFQHDSIFFNHPL